MGLRKAIRGAPQSHDVTRPRNRDLWDSAGLMECGDSRGIIVTWRLGEHFIWWRHGSWVSAVQALRSAHPWMRDHTRVETASA